MELSYGLHYSKKALREGTRNIGMAELGILEARMSIGRALHYLTGHDPYPNQSNTENGVIERSVDLINDNDVTFNDDFDRVKHLKFLISGYKLGLEKVIELRMARVAPGMTPQNQYLMTRSLDRAIDKIECSICYLGGELRVIAETDPKGDEKYPSSLPAKDIKVGKDSVADSRSTDEIIKQRAGVVSSDDIISKEKIILTEGDAQADLNGTPRPDNPTDEATAMQETEGKEKEDSLDSSEDSSEKTKEETNPI